MIFFRRGVIMQKYKVELNGSIYITDAWEKVLCSIRHNIADRNFGLYEKTSGAKTKLIGTYDNLISAIDAGRKICDND